MVIDLLQEGFEQVSSSQFPLEEFILVQVSQSDPIPNNWLWIHVLTFAFNSITEYLIAEMTEHHLEAILW